MERDLGLILAVAVITYLTRIGGLALGISAMPPRLRGFLEYVPIAAFAALIAADVATVDANMPARIVGMALATLAVIRWQRLWVGLATGMAGFWIIRALSG